MKDILVKVHIERKADPALMHSDTAQSVDERFALDVSHRFSEEDGEETAY